MQDNNIPTTGHLSSEAQSDSAQQPLPPAAREKTNRGRKRAIISGIVGLLIIIIILGLTSPFASPAKQDYQDVIQAQLDTQISYGEYQKGVLPRTVLQYQRAMNDIDTARNNLASDGENKPYRAFDEKAVAKVEENERKIADQIVANERKLEDLASELDDSLAAEKYNDYKAMRTKLYGESRTAEQYIERQIQLHRFNYGCSVLTEGTQNVILSREDAKKTVIYTEGCRAVLQDALESGALYESEKEMFKTLDEYFEESIALLRPMIINDFSEKAPLVELASRYEERFKSMELSENNDLSFDQLQDSLRLYQNVLVSQREKASGRYSEPKNDAQ